MAKKDRIKDKIEIDSKNKKIKAWGTPAIILSIAIGIILIIYALYIVKKL
ncbi:MAG: hypothetical protein ACP6IY_20580 [Promethearchaeia archaeon]